MDVFLGHSVGLIISVCVFFHFLMFYFLLRVTFVFSLLDGVRAVFSQQLVRGDNIVAHGDLKLVSVMTPRRLPEILQRTGVVDRIVRRVTRCRRQLTVDEKRETA